MNDPHIEKLVYHIETGDSLKFQDPPRLADENEAFRMTLEDGVATFSMKEQDARAAVEGYLQAWELFVDWEPPPPPPLKTPQVVELSQRGIAERFEISKTTVNEIIRWHRMLGSTFPS